MKKVVRVKGATFAFAVVVAMAMVWFGCGDGCGCDGGERSPSGPVQTVDAADDDVVAVVRLSDFEKRHFDIQHWWAVSVEQGFLVGREDIPGGIAEKPTRRVREFVESVLGEVAAQVDWEGRMDAAFWTAPDDGAPRRWAMSVTHSMDESLDERVEWEAVGRFSVSDGVSDGAQPVFSRTPDGQKTTYYVSEIDTPPSQETDGESRSLVIANFEAGAAQLPGAISAAGESSREIAGLYLWPRRLGIVDRQRRIAEVLEQRIADPDVAHSVGHHGVLQMRTRWYRAMADRKAWPEKVAFFVRIDRDEETGGARTVGVDVEAATDDSPLLAALAGALREGDPRSTPVADPGVVRIQMDLRAEGVARLAEVAMPRSWVTAASIRGAPENQLLADELEKFLAYNQGPTTLAFYESPVPMGMTAELFAGWAIDDEEPVLAEAQRFHRRLMDDYWLHLFDHGDEVRRSERSENLGKREVVLHRKTFTIGHGHGEAGVCWTVRGEEYLSYYGVRPCQRLLEVADGSPEEEPSSGLSISGDLRKLLEWLYVQPVARTAEPFGEVDVDIEIKATKQGAQRLRLSTEFTDLKAAAKLVDGLPQLREFWRPDVLFGPDVIDGELEFEQSTFQEPGLMMLGPPGMGGVLPPSFLLGMPFSHPPALPRAYRQLYFAPPGEEPEHLGHAH